LNGTPEYRRAEGDPARNTAVAEYFGRVAGAAILGVSIVVAGGGGRVIAALH